MIYRNLLVFLIAGLGALLAGCAGQAAFSEGKTLIAQGKYLEGLAKIEEATQHEPASAEFKIQLHNQRQNITNRMIAQAEAAQRQGRQEEAANAYRTVLALDERNAMARGGLDSIIAEQRHRQAVGEAEERFKKNNLREAEEIIRDVLTENPGHREARNLDARIAEKRAQGKLNVNRIAAAYRKPISLEYRDTSLRSVFDMIAKVSGINFYFDKDVRPDVKVNLNVRNTSIEDALRLLLVTNQLEQKVLSENTILVYPNTPQKLKDYQMQMVRSFYLSNADAKQVSATLKTILKTKDLVVNEKLNLIIMRDTPEAVRIAEKLVALEDVGEAEVMLEVEVMELKQTSLTELGIRFPDQLTLSLAPSAGTAFTLHDLNTLNSTKVNASLSNTIINAKRENQLSNLLANPRIRVKNKEKAKIMIGDRVPVFTTTSTATGFISDSVNYVDVGLKLEVEPNIYLDEEVSIKISLEVSSLVREIQTKSGTQSYQIGTRNATTVLKLKDGETQILAGLINDEDRRAANKLPGLGDLPIIGRLFSSHKDDSQKTEIVLSITPRLIRTVRRPDLAIAEFESGTESSVGSRSLVLETAPETEKKSVPPSSPPKSEATTSSPAPDANASGAQEPGFSLAWQAPPQVKVGEQFVASLNVQSRQSVASMPLMIAYDPTVVQAVKVLEGDFLRQGGTQSSFTSRIDAQAGQIFVGAQRPGSGSTGSGNALQVSFKALKATTKASIRLVSVSPEPIPQGGITMLPLEHGFTVGK